MAILSNFQANGQEAIKLAPPAQSVVLTYTGNAQSPTWTEYPTSVITVTSTPQTNAGTYNATAAIPAGYVWADTLKGGQRNIPWTIGKASGGTIVLSKNAVEIGEGESDTVTATLTGAGDTLSAVSSDSSVAAVSVSGNTITITDGGTEGTATITVSASGNYTYTDVTASVEVSYGVKIVTWAEGTDAQIVAMCQASDNGELDLWDYWNVGDIRTVHLSAMDATGVDESHREQDVEFVIVNKGGYSVSDTDNGVVTAFIVQQKDCLSSADSGTSTDSERGAMTDGSNLPWNLCQRRTWCNSVYRNAIPSSLVSIFKNVSVKFCPLPYNDNLRFNVDSCSDYFFLPTAKEYGCNSNVGDDKTFEVWDSCISTVNKIKKMGKNGDNVDWWTRSGGTAEKKYYYIQFNGQYNEVLCTVLHGLAPAGCIGTANVNNRIIPSWETGSDAQIVDIIQRADAGEINLADYWNIGDRRLVSLSAMSATGVSESHRAQFQWFVLVDANNQNYEYVTATSGRTYCNFVVQQENCLASSDYGNDSDSERGYMNSTNTNTGSWNSCARRTWCNEVYKNAIPSTLRSIFKQVKVKTAQTYNGTTMQVSNDYFFLPTVRETCPTNYASNTTEYNSLSEWTYYRRNRNARIKKMGRGISIRYAYEWWLRSPYAGSSRQWCYITTTYCTRNSDSHTFYRDASMTYGIAPCGCI